MAQDRTTVRCLLFLAIALFALGIGCKCVYRIARINGKGSAGGGRGNHAIGGGAICEFEIKSETFCRQGAAHEVGKLEDASCRWRRTLGQQFVEALDVIVPARRCRLGSAEIINAIRKL